MESDLGLQPSNDGKLIRLPIPAADRGAPQGARQGRRGTTPRTGASPCATCAATSCSTSRSSYDGEVGDDEERRAEERVQKLTDDHVHKIDELLKRKEAEIMEV